MDIEMDDSFLLIYLHTKLLFPGVWFLEDSSTFQYPLLLQFTIQIILSLQLIRIKEYSSEAPAGGVGKIRCS